MVYPVAKGVFESMLLDEPLSPAESCDFGIDTPDHYGALQYVIRLGLVTLDELSAALGNGESITEITRRAPDNPYTVEYCTAYDGMGADMILRRSHNSSLHCDSGLPAVDVRGLKQWFIDGKLHRSDGPAVVTDHGRMFFWRGIHILSKMWGECHTYICEDILAIENLELRRAIMEKVGFGKFLERADMVDEGVGNFQGCALYKFRVEDEVPPDDVVAVAKLKNSSPEPDGSYKDYVLRVPPGMETVVEAVKWSFGFTSSQEMTYVVQT